MRTSSDAVYCRLPAMHPCRTLVEVSIDHAHVGVHPIRAAEVAGSPDILKYLQRLNMITTMSPRNTGTRGHLLDDAI